MILPGSTIGVFGGGQLGRMLALEARRMGYRTLVLDPDPDAPAAQVADGHIAAPLDDVDAALALARRSNVVTLEWENADVAAVRALEEIVPVRPGAHVLAVAQHRVAEKDAARRLGLATTDYRPVRSLEELERAVAALGTPAILKTARGGYDGKGQRVLRAAADIGPAFGELGGDDPDLILEAAVDFEMEASVLCARSPRGEIAAFPIAENIHSGGILDVTLAPARLSPALLQEARTAGETMVEGLDVVGLLAVELFITADDRVLVNEIAPRPHNSGHHTWESCSVSQFEQQLRAVCDLPLEQPRLLRPVAMANLLGEHLHGFPPLPGVAEALGVPETALHVYGKHEVRRGRKMGHLTSLGDDVCQAEARARLARARIAREAGNPREPGTV